MLWTTRTGEVDSDLPSERVYFFKKAFKDYITFGSSDEAISSIEKELEINHSNALSELLVKSPSVGNADSPFNPTSKTALLDGLKNNIASFRDTQPYLDLCLLLDEEARANDYIKKMSVVYDAKTGDGKSLRDIASKILVEAEGKEKEAEAAHLTSIVYRAISEPTERKLLISELWFFGYHWDAFCLAKLIFPNEAFTSDLEKRLINIVKPKSIGNYMQDIKYNDMKLFDSDPIQLYRILKIDIVRNEKSTSSELAKIDMRAALSDAFRRVVLSALIKGDNMDAIFIANDGVELIKNSYKDALSEYFPSAERLLFQSSIGMIHDMLRAIRNYLSKNDVAAINEDIISKVKAVWTERVSDFWTNELPRGVFTKICECLSKHLLIVKKYFIAHTHKAATVECAIEVARLVANLPPSSDALDRKIIAVIHSVGFSYEEKNILASHLTRTKHAPVSVISDNEENFQKSLQDTGVITKWENVQDQTVQSKLTSSGDGWCHNGNEVFENAEVEPKSLITLAKQSYNGEEQTHKIPENNGNISSDSDIGSAHDYNAKLANKSFCDKKDDVLDKLMDNFVMPTTEIQIETPKGQLQYGGFEESPPKPAEPVVTQPTSKKTPVFNYGGFEVLDGPPSNFGIRTTNGYVPPIFKSNRGNRGLYRGRGTRGANYN